LSDVLGKELPYDTIAEVRQRLIKENSVFSNIGSVLPAKWASFGKDGSCDKAPFKPTIENFYITDCITRASKVMADCTEAFTKGALKDKATAHG
jgi:NADH-quinone oxidoreductase subunit G